MSIQKINKSGDRQGMSYSKIDETWSVEVLRVEAFSEGVVAPLQW